LDLRQFASEGCVRGGFALRHGERGVVVDRADFRGAGGPFDRVADLLLLPHFAGALAEERVVELRADRLVFPHSLEGVAAGSAG